jgi:hypothetical protein
VITENVRLSVMAYTVQELAERINVSQTHLSNGLPVHPVHDLQEYISYVQTYAGTGDGFTLADSPLSFSTPLSSLGVAFGGSQVHISLFGNYSYYSTVSGLSSTSVKVIIGGVSTGVFQNTEMTSDVLLIEVENMPCISDGCYYMVELPNHHTVDLSRNDMGVVDPAVGTNLTYYCTESSVSNTSITCPSGDIITAQCNRTEGTFFIDCPHQIGTSECSLIDSQDNAMYQGASPSGTECTMIKETIYKTYCLCNAAGTVTSSYNVASGRKLSHSDDKHRMRGRTLEELVHFTDTPKDPSAALEQWPTESSPSESFRDRSLFSIEVYLTSIQEVQVSRFNLQSFSASEVFDSFLVEFSPQYNWTLAYICTSITMTFLLIAIIAMIYETRQRGKERLMVGVATAIGDEDDAWKALNLLVNPEKEDSQVIDKARKDELERANLEKVIDAALPPVFREGSVYTRIAQQLAIHHRWFNLFYTFLAQTSLFERFKKRHPIYLWCRLMGLGMHMFMPLVCIIGMYQFLDQDNGYCEALRYADECTAATSYLITGILGVKSRCEWSNNICSAYTPRTASHIVQVSVYAALLATPLATIGEFIFLRILGLPYVSMPKYKDEDPVKAMHKHEYVKEDKAKLKARAKGEKLNVGGSAKSNHSPSNPPFLSKRNGSRKVLPSPNNSGRYDSPGSPDSPNKSDKHSPNALTLTDVHELPDLTRNVIRKVITLHRLRSIKPITQIYENAKDHVTRHGNKGMQRKKMELASRRANTLSFRASPSEIAREKMIHLHQLLQRHSMNMSSDTLQAVFCKWWGMHLKDGFYGNGVNPPSPNNKMEPRISSPLGWVYDFNAQMFLEQYMVDSRHALMRERSMFAYLYRSRVERNERLLYLFIKDFLGSRLNKRLLSMKDYRDSQAPVGGSSREVGWIVLVIFHVAIGGILYIYFISPGLTVTRQNAILLSYMSWLTIECVFCSSLYTLVTHFFLPTLIMKDLGVAKQLAIRGIRDIKHRHAQEEKKLLEARKLNIHHSRKIIHRSGKYSPDNSGKFTFNESETKEEKEETKNAFQQASSGSKWRMLAGKSTGGGLGSLVNVAKLALQEKKAAERADVATAPMFNTALYMYISSQMACFYPKLRNAHLFLTFWTDDPPREMSVCRQKYTNRPAEKDSGYMWMLYYLQRTFAEIVVIPLKFFQAPILVQDIVINFVVNAFAAYSALLLVVLFAYHPAAMIVPIVIAVFFVHFVIVTGKAEVSMRQSRYAHASRGIIAQTDVDEKRIALVSKLRAMNEIKALKSSDVKVSRDGETISLASKAIVMRERREKKENKLQAIAEKEREREARKEERRQEKRREKIAEIKEGKRQERKERKAHASSKKAHSSDSEEEEYESSNSESDSNSDSSRSDDELVENSDEEGEEEEESEEEEEEEEEEEDEEDEGSSDDEVRPASETRSESSSSEDEAPAPQVTLPARRARRSSVGNIMPPV